MKSLGAGLALADLPRAAGAGDDDGGGAAVVLRIAAILSRNACLSFSRDSISDAGLSETTGFLGGVDAEACLPGSTDLGITGFD